jgi:hypothetical protein
MGMVFCGVRDQEGIFRIRIRIRDLGMLDSEIQDRGVRISGFKTQSRLKTQA